PKRPARACKKEIRAPDLATSADPMHLRYEFAASLCHHEWDFLRRPEWRPYACTVLAHESAPETLKRDAALTQRAAPQPRVGLGGPVRAYRLSWLSPEMKARDEAF